MRMQKEYRHLKSDISYKSPFGCFEIGFKCPGTAIPTVPGQGHLYYTIMGFASTVQEQNRVRAAEWDRAGGCRPGYTLHRPGNLTSPAVPHHSGEGQASVCFHLQILCGAPPGVSLQTIRQESRTVRLTRPAGVPH